MSDLICFVKHLKTWHHLAREARTVTGCVSTQRHKRVSNVGFANRDFTSLSLKKIEAQGKFEPSPSCLVNSASIKLRTTPLPTTPLGQSLYNK